jgi:dipeptidyl aminopeptidase/acylaminoacyl peptidase
LKTALDKFGIANELVIVEGADHGLIPEEARAEEWGKAVGWLERWVWEVEEFDLFAIVLVALF